MAPDRVREGAPRQVNGALDCEGGADVAGCALVAGDSFRGAEIGEGAFGVAEGKADRRDLSQRPGELVRLATLLAQIQAPFQIGARPPEVARLRVTDPRLANR